MERAVLLLLSLGIFLPNIIAQESLINSYHVEDTTKEKWGCLGFSLHYHNNQDVRMSNQIYDAPGVGLHFGEVSFKNRMLWVQQFNLSIANSFSTHFINITSHGDLAGLTQIKKTEFYLGGHAQVFYNNRISERLENSAYNHDLIAGLGLAAAWHKGFSLFKKDLTIQSQVRVPLISYLNRIPEFSIGRSENVWTSPFSMPFILWQTQIISPYKKSAKNKWSLMYSWTFYGRNETEGIHRLRIAQHSFKYILWLHKI